MARLFGIHNVTLRPGVKEEEFERFVVEQVYPLETPPGWTNCLLKSTGDQQASRYLVLWEIESPEALTRWMPAPGVYSEDAKLFRDSHPELRRIGQNWLAFVEHVPDESVANYMVVE